MTDTPATRDELVQLMSWKLNRVEPSRRYLLMSEILNALTQAGLAVVPAEARPDQVKAASDNSIACHGGTYATTYRAMINAGRIDRETDGG